MAATPTTTRTATTIPRPTEAALLADRSPDNAAKNKKREWHCYGMLNSSERHYDIMQQIRQAFHFWRNLISKNCEWLLLMILEWINAILTLFFGEGGWKAHTECQYSIKRVTDELFSKLPKNRYDEQSKEKNELKFQHLNWLQILETVMCDRGR